MDERLIQLQAMATGVACRRMTPRQLRALHDTIGHANCLPARSQWDRKAAAHAEIFGLLADAADDRDAAQVLTSAAVSVRDVMLVGGHAADGMIIGRILHYMWRLTGRTADSPTRDPSNASQTPAQWR